MRSNFWRLFSTRTSGINRKLHPSIVTAPLLSKETKGIHFPENSGKNFDKYFINPKPKKAWDGQDKDEFFRKKYNYIHAERKQRRRPLKPIKSKSNNLNTQTTDNNSAGSKDTKEEDLFLDDRKEAKKSKLFSPNSVHEYVYGRNPVLSVLRGDKRSIISKVFTSDKVDTVDNQVAALAKSRGIPIEYNVPKLRMNVLSRNGVHNKYIVETRPLIVPEIFGLGEFDMREEVFETKLLKYNTEVDARYPVNMKQKANPLGIFLDEVTDPHNIGAIIRSAYFFGVDFIVFSEKNCAPLSPVVAKTSAGMVDHMQIFSCPKPLQFIEESKQNDWKVIGTVSRPVISQRGTVPSCLKSFLDTQPCLLLLGSEGKGLRKSVLDLCTDYVALRGSHDARIIDSLNVSVASALLLSKFYEPEVFDNN